MSYSPVVIKYSDFDIKRLHKLECGRIVYDFENDYRTPAIQSPWLKLNCYGLNTFTNRFKIPLNLDNDNSKQFYNLISDLDKMLDKEDDRYYCPIIHTFLNDDDEHHYRPDRPDFLMTSFRYDKYSPDKIITAFFFNNNNVRTNADVRTINDLKYYFQPNCEFRFIMRIKLNNFSSTGYSLGIWLESVEVKTDRTELSTELSTELRTNYLRSVIDSDDDDIVLTNLKTVPLKGDLPVKLISGIFHIDDKQDYPDKPNSECPISKEEITNNEVVIIFNRKKYGFKHMYKIASLQVWINYNPKSPTDPSTREPITTYNLERYIIKFM